MTHAMIGRRRVPKSRGGRAWGRLSARARDSSRVSLLHAWPAPRRASITTTTTHTPALGSRHRSLTMFDSFFARVGEAAATPPDYIKVRAATAAPAALLNLAAR